MVFNIFIIMAHLSLLLGIYNIYDRMKELDKLKKESRLLKLERIQNGRKEIYSIEELDEKIARLQHGS